MAPLTVTADAQSRLYGATNPALTYVSSGLVNGDTLSGNLATLATTTSNVGAYGITQGTLAATSNYALNYSGANLNVTAAPLAVTAALLPVTAEAQFQAFASYFATDILIVDDDNECISAASNFQTAFDASFCSPLAILHALNQYGRVDLSAPKKDPANRISCAQDNPTR